MQPSERAEFAKLVQTLFAGFDTPPTDTRIDAYWRGLSSMHLLAFERVVNRALGEHGEDDLPTPKRCHGIHRELQAEARSNSVPKAEPEKPKGDRFDHYANRVLLAVLCERISHHGSAASAESLARMIHVKHIYADGYRQQCADEPEAALDMRDALVARLTPLFEPAESPQPSSNDRRPLVPAAEETWRHPSHAMARPTEVTAESPAEWSL